jgi:serine protease AprX
VAVIDTGITEVADLEGRIVAVNNGGAFGGTSPCKNFSGEPTCEDSYGHGTFIAGIIAGNGAASAGKWKGIAPQAKLLSVKIAGETGAADVSTLLAALQWVVSYRDTYDIKVLNLSLGTTGTQSYRTDPLNYAVQEAWEAGIVVVVSASNLGPEPGTISKPGDDPWVITVAATDDRGTVGLGDDQLPNFSSRGPTAADGMPKPDVAAPGGHIISLRAPGSRIDTLFPNYVDGAYRKGSGTSMAAAVASGTAALMMQKNPTWTPDRVKYAMAATTRPAASDDPMAVGSGVVDAHAATFSAPAGTANGGLDRSSGLGSLDASRGTVQVQADDAPQTVVSGLLTLQLLLYNPIEYAGLPWTPLTWQLSQWYGASWYGASWYGASWYGAWE